MSDLIGSHAKAQGVRYSSVGSEEVSCFATYHFRTGSRPTVAKCFSEYTCPSKCIWSGCRQADAVVSQAYPGCAEICPGFPPPQAARVTVASEEKGLWVVWYDSDVVNV